MKTALAERPPPRFDTGTLVFGIGNSARGDDGLGWAFLDRVQDLPGFAAEAEYRYQLQVEDALLAARFERIVFVDACRDALDGGFRWAPCAPQAGATFTTHELTPSAVLHYARSLYGATPSAGVLTLQGSHWGLHDGLSAEATAALEAALRYCSVRRCVGRESPQPSSSTSS
jgi:hydrogenase maturation protease